MGWGRFGIGAKGCHSVDAAQAQVTTSTGSEGTGAAERRADGKGLGPGGGLLRDRRRIRPFIDTRLMWRAETGEPGHCPSREITRSLDPDRVGTMVRSERGELFCICPQGGGQREMAFEGFERDRETLKRRCPAGGLRLRLQGQRALPPHGRMKGRGLRADRAGPAPRDRPPDLHAEAPWKPLPAARLQPSQCLGTHQIPH